MDNSRQVNSSQHRPASTVTEKSDDGNKRSFTIEVPSVSLPKGGGAIKSIDEKFSVNAVNGTSSLSIPVPVSAARGFAPSLNLAYSSGAGNGIFGLGWSLSISSIKRKTEKELPQYFDAVDSDTFIISGAEDLVPEYKKDNTGKFIKNAQNNFIPDEFDLHFNGIDYSVRLYKPRIEGLFSRIERWTEKLTGYIHWRVISKDNITLLLGPTSSSRIADPANDRHIFEWLPEFTYDDKGNCILYEYKIEDNARIPTALHNKNRLNGNAAFTNTYLKRIRSGNKTPYHDQGERLPPAGDFMFETVFDYGEHHPVTVPYNEVRAWPCRKDAFSFYRPGFEIRTCRLCNRILLYHLFKELPGSSALVKSLELTYDDNGADGFTFLKTAVLTGYTKHDDQSYSQKSFPPFSFEYQQHAWSSKVQSISPGSLVNAPAGIDDSAYQFTDLYSEGLLGILTEQGDGWFYKNNLGDGNFTRAKRVMQKPSFNGLQQQLQLTELESDGVKQITNRGVEPKGFFELNDDDEWKPFTPFQALPSIDFNDPNTRQLDLNGDGLADILITGDQVFRWYPSKGKKGFDISNTVPRSYDEEKGPAIIFADGKQTIFLADMNGDGLTDIVRIRSSEVCYWPNLGYGKFGCKVAMDNAPVFDAEDNFNTRYIKLADIDGSGTTDIIYLGQNQFRIWLNQQGNSFTSEPTIIDSFPKINNLVTINITDLLGTGLSCIVWNSSLPGDSDAPLRYIDVMDSLKPHVLTSYKNNLGKEVSLQYTPSTKFYIADKLASTPWITKLHFPVHCVSSVITYDRIRKTRFASEYSYHHGYYDHAEREFRGFGRVDQTDSETINHFIVQSAGGANNIKEDNLHQPPVLTKTWFHTGAFLRNNKIVDQFSHEYFQNTSVKEKVLPEPSLPSVLTIDEYRQALRACKGFILRKEVYALDEDINNKIPYIAEQHNCLVRLLQPQGSNKYGVFLIHESESITYHYERHPGDPRTAQSFIFEVDDYGNILSSADMVYARKNPAAASGQKQVHIVYTENYFTNDIQETFFCRGPLPSSVIKYELTGIPRPPGYFSIDDLKKYCKDAAVIDHEIIPDGSAQKRIVEITRTDYLKDDTSATLGFGIIESKALLHKQYKAAFNENTINNLLGARLTALQLAKTKKALTGNDPANFTDSQGAYLTDNILIAGKLFTYYWLHSGFMDYDKNNFFLGVKYTDAFKHETNIEYDPSYFLFVKKIADPKTNITSTEKFNYRTISPLILADMNGNRTGVRYDELGMVVKTFVMGKQGANQGDLLDETKGEIKGANDEPTTELEYSLMNWFVQSAGISKADLVNFNYKPKPDYVKTTAYETHYFPDQVVRNRKQTSFSYSDGSGKEIMKKVQAKRVATNPQPRWIGTGRTILNNKGNPVKQYEPFFSTTEAFEDEKDIVESGVTPVIHYDPLDRVIKTDFADGSFSRVEFDSWTQVTHDQIDTITEPNNQWYIDRHSPAITDAEPNDPATRAAWLSAIIAGTPSTVHLDTLGRSFLSEQQNRLFTVDDFTKKAALQIIDKYHTHTTFDIQGNPLVITDPLNNPVMQYEYDMAGNKIFQNSMDAGRRWLLNNAGVKPLFAWDEKDQEFSYLYDELSRPLQSLVSIQGAASGSFDKIIYGEGAFMDTDNNLRGKIHQRFDTAGLVTNDQYDFKGNLLKTTRQLLEKYDSDNIPDWTVMDPSHFYSSSNAYDALNRPVKLVTPDNSVQYHLFNEAGLLDKVLLNHHGKIAVPGESFEALSINAALTSFVIGIDYNEKGQRSRIVYGNNTITVHTYDTKTFRLSRLKTTSRDDTIIYQDLNYTHDPIGNVVQISDDAQSKIYFGNTFVEPVQSYRYDALYQLIYAKGREHVGQNVLQENGFNKNYRNFSFAADNIVKPGDTVAMRNYTREFSYDKAGNIIVLAHKGSDGTGYTRNYTYNNTSVNHDTNNNRLLTTQVAGDPLIEYDHDVHGNMIVSGAGINKKGVPHLSRMDWNFKDQLYATASTVMNDGTPGTTFYVYDAEGIRVRKTTNAQNSNKKTEERIYLHGYEIYRVYNADGTIKLERQSLHVMDDKSRIAMVETKVVDTGRSDTTTANQPFTRYQYGNHLGSACLELDENAAIISYEEYHPYGTTSYQAMDATINPIAKRYRYTGLERDEENGFGYHNARYYVMWLGRWASSDPLGLVDKVNLFSYSGNNPVNLIDKHGTQSEGPDAYIDILINDIVKASRTPTPYASEVLAESKEEDLLNKKSIAAKVAEDKDNVIKELGPEFISRVEKAAAATGLDPGLLTSSLLAETLHGSLREYRENYLGGHGDLVRSDVIGLDDFDEEKEKMKDMKSLMASPTPASTFVPENIMKKAATLPPAAATALKEAHKKNVYALFGDKAILAHAKYLKQEEKYAGIRAAKHEVNFSDLPIEQRFFLTRLRMNPGLAFEKALANIKSGRDPLQHGITSAARIAGDSIRGATITAVQGLHISRLFFKNTPFENNR